MPTRRREETRVGERSSAQERDTTGPLAPLLLCLFLPPGLPCVSGQPGVLFAPPEVLTPLLGPSLALFSLASPFLVF